MLRRSGLVAICALTLACSEGGATESTATSTGPEGGSESEASSGEDSSTSTTSETGLPEETGTETGTETGSETETGSGTETGTETGEPEPSPEQSTVLLSDQNRRYEGVMFGGWGPHLRGLMRAPDDTLWFTVDAGEDVQNNREIHYYREEPGQQWTHVATGQHAEGVQQNSASILRGSVILTYSVNIVQRVLEECYFDTAAPQLDQLACNTIAIGGPYQTPPSSNYVGAALGPTGAKLVWFTVVGPNGSPGQWIYTVDFGGGWNGPFVLDLPGYNDYAYVHARFSAPNHVVAIGQGYTGAYPNGSYQAVIADFELGEAPALYELQSGEPGVGFVSSGDLWVDPDTGDVHVLARTDAGGAAYFYRPAGSEWGQHLSPVSVLPNTGRARLLDPEGGPLVLARGGGGTHTGVELRMVALADILGPIDWDAAESLSVEFPDGGEGFASPAAIYVETSAYHDNAVGGQAGSVELATCGQYPERDVEIWHTRVTP